MKHHSFWPRTGSRTLVIAVAGALALTGCSGGSSSDSSGTGGGGGSDKTQLLTIPREDQATFSQNFNPFAPTAAPMTQQAIYEPMLVFNPADGTTTPWLATKWTVADDGTGIDFTLRDGVKWSDGQPLTADDVVFTFELQKKLLGGFEYLDTVKVKDASTVSFTFNTPFSPGLYEIGAQVIVPKHVWSAIQDPANDTNSKPIGTGPYTEVTNFQSQSFQLLRNPNYWQPDKQKIQGIQMLAFAGNDSANLATVNGETDWADQFIPDIQHAFVDKDSEHRHFWFPPLDATIHWQLNTTKAPFDNVEVRKALSMAIDRDAIASVAMQGYTHPADCTGLSDAYNQWRSEKVASGCDWTKRDVDGANALLDKAGYPRGADGMRTKPDGSPFAFAISVGSTSSDWLSVANIISQNAAEVGVQVTVNSPDWSAVVASYEDGSFDSGIVWSNIAPTPYQYYRGAMSTETVKDVGTQTFQNYHRFGLEEADTLLADFAAKSDPEQQAATMDQLQEAFAENAPIIPLFPGPRWGVYNTTRFTGFPDETNPYATLSTRSPTTVLVLTSIVPV
jgi:peptide/nickel transport system substrate-binding protein